jgi:hypothetical protein
LPRFFITDEALSREVRPIVAGSGEDIRATRRDAILKLIKIGLFPMQIALVNVYQIAGGKSSSNVKGFTEIVATFSK